MMTILTTEVWGDASVTLPYRFQRSRLESDTNARQSYAKQGYSATVTQDFNAKHGFAANGESARRTAPWRCRIALDEPR